MAQLAFIRQPDADTGIAGGGLELLDPTFRANLQAAADAAFPKTAVINVTKHGGYRTADLNKQIRGAGRSNHLTGMAVDANVTFPDGSVVPLATAFQNSKIDPRRYGLRLGTSFLYNGKPDVWHVDNAANQPGGPYVATYNQKPAATLVSKKTAPATGSYGAGGRLDYGQLTTLWVLAGGKIEDAPFAAAIALAESGGAYGNDRNALNNNPSTGDYSVGPWQINYFGQLSGSRTRAYGNAQTVRNDPLANAKAAVSLFYGQGPSVAWHTTVSNGTYKRYLPSGSRIYMGAPSGGAATISVPGAGGGPETTTETPAPKTTPTKVVTGNPPPASTVKAGDTFQAAGVYKLPGYVDGTPAGSPATVASEPPPPPNLVVAKPSGLYTSAPVSNYVTIQAGRTRDPWGGEVLTVPGSNYVPQQYKLPAAAAGGTSAATIAALLKAYAPPTLDALEQAAAKQANATLAGQVDAFRKLMEYETGIGQQQQALIAQASQAAANMLSGQQDIARKDYQDAIANTQAVARGFSGQAGADTQAQVDQANADLAAAGAPGRIASQAGNLHDVLWGLGGAIPTDELGAGQAAAVAAAQALPSQQIAYGQAQGQGALNAAQQRADAYKVQIANATANLPTLTQQYLTQFQNAGNQRLNTAIQLAKLAQTQTGKYTRVGNTLVRENPDGTVTPVYEAPATTKAAGPYLKTWGTPNTAGGVWGITQDGSVVNIVPQQSGLPKVPSSHWFTNAKTGEVDLFDPATSTFTVFRPPEVKGAGPVHIATNSDGSHSFWQDNGDGTTTVTLAPDSLGAAKVVAPKAPATKGFNGWTFYFNGKKWVQMLDDNKQPVPYGPGQKVITTWTGDPTNKKRLQLKFSKDGGQTWSDSTNPDGTFIYKNAPGSTKATGLSASGQASLLARARSAVRTAVGVTVASKNKQGQITDAGHGPESFTSTLNSVLDLNPKITPAWQKRARRIVVNGYRDTVATIAKYMHAFGTPSAARMTAKVAAMQQFTDLSGFTEADGTLDPGMAYVWMLANDYPPELAIPAITSEYGISTDRLQARVERAQTIIGSRARTTPGARVQQQPTGGPPVATGGPGPSHDWTWSDLIPFTHWPHL